MKIIALSIDIKKIYLSYDYKIKVKIVKFLCLQMLILWRFTNKILYNIEKFNQKWYNVFASLEEGITLIIPKVFENGEVPICFAANNAFLPFTGVMIQSIIDHANEHDNYDIVVLCSDADETLAKKMVSLADGKDKISIRVYDVNDFLNMPKNLFTDNIYTQTTYSPEIYYRLLIPTLMPQYDKVLYFDGDMLALTDVAELYHGVELGDNMIASSRDYAGLCHCYKDNDDRRWYREEILGLRNVDDYILSGMLVINVPEFNKWYTADKLMEIAGYMDWRQHDQDILNVVCEDRILLIDGAWDHLQDFGWTNYLPTWLKREYDETTKNIKISHFAGQRKPWVNNSLNSDKFWDTCARTPFFDDVMARLSPDFDLPNSRLYQILQETGRIAPGQPC